jgi:DNA-binding transcriptional regulator YiaG
VKRKTIYQRTRKRLNMSQAQFASLLGVHPMTVSRWETGRVTPNGACARLLEALSGPHPENIVKALKKT